MRRCGVDPSRMTHDLAALTRACLAAIEAADDAVALAFFHPEIEQIEWPNRLVANGATRDLAKLKTSFERGKSVVDGQRYDVKRLVALGDTVAFEAVWTATVKIPLGELKPGDVMKAYIAAFLTFRDGLIVSQRNFDCFEPF